MAMSTVVGISLATTWLLNEQQQIGRRPDVSVGASPPVPSPDAAPTEAAALSGHTVAPPAPAHATGATALPGARLSTPPARPAGHPSAPSTAAATASTGPAAQATPDASATPDAPTSPPALAGPSAPAAPPTPNTGPQPISAKPCPETTFTGIAATEQFGRTGSRHTLELTVEEATTVLQVEVRLHRPDALPGTVPATDLPGAVVTVALERDTLVYRFTTRPGHDIEPDTYTFTVTGTHPHTGTPETWTASAFATTTPRALATRGTFQ